MSTLAWLLAVGALYRITLLVVADTITEPLRDRVMELVTGPRPRHDYVASHLADRELWRIECRTHDEGMDVAEHQLADWRDDHHDQWASEWRARAVADHRLAYLITCPWCASVWLAPVVLGSALLWSDGWGWQLGAGALALSGAVGVLSTYASPD